MKPTRPRSTVMAIAPSWTFDECSSVVSSASAASEATTSGDNRVAATSAPTKSIAPYTSVAGAPTTLQQEARGDHRHRSGDAGDQAELGVGLDEFGFGPHGRRHDRRFRHGVGLLQHERGEHEREQRQGVEILRHQQGEDHPRQRHHLDDELAAAGHTVDQRSDQRRDDQERSEPDHEEQQHARAGSIEIDVEEQRVGERHHHGGVAAHHQRMGDRQATELGGGRSLRRVDPFHRADPT